jgi:hypothetical protein
MSSVRSAEFSEALLELQRAAGFLLKRFGDLKLQLIHDSRRAAGKRWKLEAVIKMALLGMMAGCKSVAEVEILTFGMSKDMRKQLGIPRRLPDTTLREILLRLEPDDMRQALHALIHSAVRRKVLGLKGFPFHVLATDGKATAIPHWDNEYSQRKTYDDGRKAHGIVRSVNACLVSTEARPVVDTIPIPAATNEMGVFPEVFSSLVKHYGQLFQLITYDAGVPSQENCKLVVDAGKDFFFHIKNENWHLVQEAERRLGVLPLQSAAAQTEDSEDNHKTVIRRVFVVEAPSLPFLWAPVKTLVRVHAQHIVDGQVTTEENRFYISSLVPEALTAKQWLHLARSHWGVENNVHWVLDAILVEDKKPWIKAVPKATFTLMVLRRIACSILTLLRVAVSSEDSKERWKMLLDWVHRTAIKVTQKELDGLRPRRNEIFAAS